MSIFQEDLAAALEPVLDKHTPGVLMDFVVVASYMDTNAEEGFVISAPPGQRVSSSVELLGVGSEVFSVLLGRKIEEMIDDE